MTASDLHEIASEAQQHIEEYNRLIEYLTATAARGKFTYQCPYSLADWTYDRLKKDGFTIKLDYNGFGDERPIISWEEPK